MPRFHYQAIDPDEQTVEGHIESEDVKSAASALQRQGLTVTSIGQVRITPTEDSPTPTDDTTSPFAPMSDTPSPDQSLSDTGSTDQANAEVGSDRVSLERQVRRLALHGKPLAPALEAYAKELPPGKQRRLLRRVAGQLARGDEASPHPIDEDLVPLLSAGASTGDLSLILSGIVDESRRSIALRRRFTTALAYPGLLLCLLLGILALFSWLLVPAFRQIFADFGIELPGLTRLLFGFHAGIHDTRGLVLLIPALIFAVACACLSLAVADAARDRILHWVPLLGGAAKLSSQSRFARSMANLIQAQVPLDDALRISARNSGHFLLRREAQKLATRLERGETLGQVPLRHIPNTALHAFQANVQPAVGAEVLGELSWLYDQQMENRLGLLDNIIEPLFIVILGVVVGAHVIALFLPLVSLIQNLT